MLNWIRILKWLFKTIPISDANRTLEILALRSQLAIVQQSMAKRDLREVS